ncbi:MAG: hypothetical protein LBU11_01360 [Zoogloeaceae bacterium]|jgi:hypothetical protein|nr:hypothetical protein [Zoogloeaceae bacterium]
MKELENHLITRYFLDDRDSSDPALYIVMGRIVAKGQRGQGWYRGEDLNQYFFSEENTMHDGMLINIEEAMETARSMGLPDIIGNGSAFMAEIYRENLERLVAEIEAKPKYPNRPHFFRYYLDDREKDRLALYVRLEGTGMAVQGRKGLGWRGGDSMSRIFMDLEHDLEIRDDNLLTEAETREVARSLGLPDIDTVKPGMIENFTEYNKYPPNIVADDEEALLVRRKEAYKKAKKGGWR